MKTEEEIRQYLSKYTTKLKPNPNHFIIIDKWNSKVLKPYKHEIFDYISKCVDEAIIEAIMEHPCCFPNITNFEYIDIDKDEHLWYNTFNKWSWAKFENGVVKI